MTRFLNISKVAVAVMAVCSLLFISCGEQVTGNDTLEVSLKNSSVPSGKGQVFVSVKCASSWTLSLTDDSGAGIDWATINPSSGHGDKNKDHHDQRDGRAHVVGRGVLELTLNGVTDKVDLTRAELL